MLKILILLVAVFVIFIIARKPGSGKTEEIQTEEKDKIITYVCPVCGKKNCNCYKEDIQHKQ